MFVTKIKSLNHLHSVRPYLEFRGYEHGSGADKLQHLPVDRSLGQVVVRHLYSQVEGLVVQFKVLLNTHISRARLC